VTARLYYTDSYLREFRAVVMEARDGGRRVYLDRTAFYPASGGQPHDTGTIGGVPVVEVVEEGDGRIAHVTGDPVAAGEAECRIDWPRRFDHMQQHSGQHLLSAVLAGLYGAQTVSFHLGAESSTIDVGVPSLSAAELAAAEARANEIVFENRAVSVSFEDEATGLRKPSEREGTLRIVTITGLDRSACGGTHVRATGEIGTILLGRLDRAHGNLRIEFRCGGRAVRRARADYDALSAVARTLSVPLDDAPAQAAAQAQLLEAAEKARRKMALELAQMCGRELYRETAPDAAGLRLVIERSAAGALGEEVRAKAQAFAGGAKACFIAVAESEQPAVLMAVSQDAGVHAGNTLKEALGKLGGRGGGNAHVGQGSLPSRAPLDELLRDLRAALDR
jgi:alanyl-tRNA synthetase